MSLDPGTEPKSGSDESLLPPVFTRWSEPRPARESIAEGAADAAAMDSVSEPATGSSTDLAGSDPVETALPFDDLDGIPNDAFIYPDSDESALPAETSRSVNAAGLEAIAERLERLAEAIRRGGQSALERQALHGDRLEAAIANLLIGYHAANES